MACLERDPAARFDRLDTLDPMECPEHHQTATGVCMRCGRALCPACGGEAGAGRRACGEACARVLDQHDQAFALLTRQTLQTAQASAVFSGLCSLLSLAGAAGAWFYLPVPFLVWFCAGCGLVFMATAIWQARIARRQAGPASGGR